MMTRTVLVFSYIVLMGSLAFAGPQTFTYQGRIVGTDGHPLEYAHVSFEFRITNPSGSCVLYREQVNNVDMSNSKGIFETPIGSGTKIYPSSTTVGLIEVFSNSGSLSCEGGSTYNPTNTDGRLLRVQFHDGSGWKLIAPDSVIRAVPFASYSTNSLKFADKDVTDFVMKTSLPLAACTASEVVSFDGTKFSCIADPGGGGGGGGTITSVVGSGPITVTGTTALTVGATVGTTAGTLAAGNDSRFTDARNPTGTAGGDLSGSYPNPSVAKIQGRAVDSTLPIDGQVLLWDNTASTWKPQFVRMQDIRNAWGGTSMMPSTACAVNEAMVWNVITDRFICQAIALNASAITAGTLNAARLGTGTADNTTYLRGDGTWQTISTSDSSKLPLAGGTMTGDIVMGGHKITNVSNVPFVATNPSGTEDGKTLRWNNTAGQWEWFTAGAAGAGINTINGEAGTAQSLAPTASGTSYGFTTTANTHTFSIPSASGAGVTAGTISKTEYDAFNAKQAAGSYITTLSGDVTSSGFTSGTVTATIANNAVTSAKINDGAVTGAKLEDVSGLTAGTYTKVTVDAKGRVTTGASLAATDIPNLDAAKITSGTMNSARLGSGTADNTTYLRGDGTWQTISMTETDPKVGANTTNYLSKWNGTALVASTVIESSGNIGIGTSSPTVPLEVTGNTKHNFVLNDAITINSGSSFNETFLQNNYGGGTFSNNLKMVGATWTFPRPFLSGAVVSVNNGDIAMQVAPAAASPTLTDAVIIKNSGNVGIGKNNPADKLDVNGKIRATHICAGDGTNCKDLTTSWGGSGLSSLNGSTQATQTFAVGSSGNGPAITTNTGTGVHTLDIPLAASAGTVTAGLISNADYVSFTNKLGTATTFAGDVTGTYNGTVVEKIRGVNVSTTAPAADQVMVYKTASSSWVPKNFGIADLRTSTGATQFGAASCTASQTLTWSSITDAFSCSNIASLDAAAVSSGTFNVARLGSGTADNTKYLRGDGTWQTVSVTESDPKVGSNTTNYLSKWNGTALVASSVIDSSGKVGIGASSPGYALTVGDGTANDGFIMARGYGTVGTGTTLAVAGAGRRMFWYPKKGAFRSGGVEGGQADWWDDSNIGNYSSAFGLGSNAQGQAAFAAGNASAAVSDSSFAAGSFSIAAGDTSVAAGGWATTYGQYAVALGRDIRASGDNSIVLGATVNTGSGYAGSGGDYSMGIGLGYASGTAPTITGTSSMGIFMGDRSGDTVSASNVMVLMGGKMGIGTLAPTKDLDVNGTIRTLASVESAAAITNSGTSYTIADLSRNVRLLTLNNNTTITLPALTSLGSNDVFTLTIKLTQDATGSRTVTWAGGGNTIKWDGGVAPTISPTASKETIIQFTAIGGVSTWYGSMVWKEN